jgi:hypothetical protein
MPCKELVPLAPAVPPPAWQQSPSTGVPWPQQKQDRQSDSAIVTVRRWAKRNNHFTVPLGIPVALWTAGIILSKVPAKISGPVDAVALTAAVCVWIFAPHKWRDKHGDPQKREVWYARLSALLAAIWLIAATLLGPLSGIISAAVLGGVLLAGCAVWGWFWWRHKRPRGIKKQQRLIAQCDAWWQSHCHNWNLHGSRVIDAELHRVTLRIRVRGLAGRHTLHHFRQAIPFIESAAEGQADIGLVRVEPVRGKPSEADIFLKQDNPLRGEVKYDMDLAPGSVHEPAQAGQDETGQDVMHSLRVNRFTIGKTRSGKSNDLLVGVANLSGCPDARTVLIDLKGGRSARPVLKAGAAEYVITEIDGLGGARMYLRMMTAEAKAREMYAYDGNEQLMATPDIPALFTMVDETYGLTATEDGAGDTECRRHVGTLSSQGSGVEEYVWIYTQHGSLETSVGTEQIRGNLAWRTCYAVTEARHGAYVIPEYNRLDASRLEEKGTCYMKYGKDVAPEQIRAPHMPHQLLTRIASQNAALLGSRPPLRLYCGDQIAYQSEDGPVTWQQWWDQRWLYLHPAFHADSPQYQAASAAAGPQPPAGPPPPPSPEAADAARTADRIAPDAVGVPDDFRPDPELVKTLPQVIASQEDRFCETLEAATQDSPVTPRDLITACGMSRSWVFDRLGALAEIGMVTQVSRGRYATVPGSDIRAGLAEIKDRNDRLAREARDLLNAQ